MSLIKTQKIKTRKEQEMIHNYLKIYFKENRITQSEIEKLTGIARSKINLTLNGKRKMTADELLIIANKFDLDLNKIKRLNNIE